MPRFIVHFVQTPTNYNADQVMVIEAADADEALRTWSDAMCRRGHNPARFAGKRGGLLPVAVPYKPGTLGRVVDG